MSKHGHHGGAWKVAYADFVTAMMALFLVLWLTAQDEKIKEAVERAFRHPFSSPLANNPSPSVIPGSAEDPISSKSQPGKIDYPGAVELMFLRQIAQELLQHLPQEQDPNEQSLQIETTSEGVRITVFDRSRKAIFEPQSTDLTPYGDWVLSTLAWPLSTYTNLSLEVEGHTERGHPPARQNYGNWELSTDRANTARRKLIEHGVGAQHVQKVAGFADTQPLPKHAPEDEVNRRITVMLKLRPDRPSS